MNSDLQFGIQMTVMGMGTVFLLLAILMGVLTVIGRMDRPEPEEPAAAPLPEPAQDIPLTPVKPAPLQILSNGAELDADVLAAISVAVLTHRQVRRQEAAPAMRTHQPGSLQYASRWVTLGRSLQSQNPPKR